MVEILDEEDRSFKQKKSSSDQVLQESPVIGQRDRKEGEHERNGRISISNSSITTSLSPRSQDYSPVKKVNERDVPGVNQQEIGI